jgi:hypothetical protein
MAQRVYNNPAQLTAAGLLPINLTPGYPTTLDGMIDLAAAQSDSALARCGRPAAALPLQWGRWLRMVYARGLYNLYCFNMVVQKTRAAYNGKYYTATHWTYLQGGSTPKQRDLSLYSVDAFWHEKLSALAAKSIRDLPMDVPVHVTGCLPHYTSVTRIGNHEEIAIDALAVESVALLTIVRYLTSPVGRKINNLMRMDYASMLSRANAWWQAVHAAAVKAARRAAAPTWVAPVVTQAGTPNEQTTIYHVFELTTEEDILMEGTLQHHCMGAAQWMAYRAYDHRHFSVRLPGRARSVVTFTLHPTGRAVPSGTLLYSPWMACTFANGLDLTEYSIQHLVNSVLAANPGIVLMDAAAVP